MKNSVYRRKICRLCNSRNLELVLKMAPTPVGDAYVAATELNAVQETFPNDLFFCLDCSHAQLLDVIDPEILYGHFTYKTAISLGLTDHFQQYAADVINCVKAEPGSLTVDIGSNDGTLLQFFQKKGMRILGVDPARAIAAEANARGIETLATYFSLEVAEKILQDKGPASIITSNNTFANIDNLENILAGVKLLLADKGTLIIETGYIVDQILAGCFDNIYHEHIGYFSVIPMVNLCKLHGLELYDIQKIDTKGGSIRCYIQKKGAGRQISQNISEIIRYEKNQGFASDTPYKKLAGQLAEGKRKILSLCDELLARGKTIAGYGASVGSTTFIYEFDLGDKLSFIADDNSLKHGLFSPGHHIPVFSPQVLYDNPPDYIMILAWRYADTIISKNQAFIDQGGHFIIPWPRLIII